MGKVNVSLSVSDSYIGRMSEVTRAAKKAGMVVESELEDLGVLTGSIEAEKLGALHGVAGVSHVEEQREVAIPPPDSPVQ